VPDKSVLLEAEPALNSADGRLFVKLHDDSVRQIGGLIANSAPLPNGSAAPGSSGQLADAAHVHPTDLSRASVNHAIAFAICLS
jgi:hypothetical protein